MKGKGLPMGLEICWGEWQGREVAALIAAAPGATENTTATASPVPYPLSPNLQTHREAPFPPHGTGLRG